MKTLVSLIVLLFSTSCFAQRTIIGRVYSITTGIPLSNISLRLDNQQRIQADTTGVFEIKTTKRKIKLSVIPENIFHLDTVIFANSVTDTIHLFVPYPIDSSLADYDIKHDQIQLFCGGGIAPLAPLPSDKIFENKYSVRYHMLDCVMPGIRELNSYNQKVALYLDSKYGLDWRLTVRPDIFGVTRKTRQ